MNPLGLVKLIPLIDLTSSNSDIAGSLPDRLSQ